MIENLPERPIKADVRLPAPVAASFAAFRGEMVGRSQLVWGEHCSECAYPTCYAHCAFYTPRSDFNCRRFEAGFEPLPDDPALHHVRFRKWGKLQGRGPAALVSARTAKRRARIDHSLSTAITDIPAPHALKQSLAWRWAWGKRAARPASGLKADGFVVEAWASDGEPHPFTLTLMNVGDYGGRMFQTRFDVDAQYRRLFVPLAEIAAQVDLDRPYLAQIEPVGEARGVRAVFGVCDFVALRERFRSAAKTAKIVVWDLDETVWTGVLAEDGLHGVRLRPEALAAIKMLDQRGVLQSVASKNDAAEAMAALARFGLGDYFLHPQIHWRPKSGSVAAVAQALNLGLDSVVFIDDQPFERAEVQSAHPMVRTLSHLEVGDLAAHPWFDLPATDESRGRRALYQAEAQRSAAYQDAGSDYAAFLRTSDIRLCVDPLSAADVERVFELSQRTNQLNFTGRKYGRDAVRALLASNGPDVGLCLRCSDRFGDYGLIGFAVADFKHGRVSELFLSCRVQRKRAEQALMAWLGRAVGEAGATELRVAYAATGRNGAALDMLLALGFTASGEDAGLWTRPAGDPIAESDIVAITARSAAKAA